MWIINFLPEFMTHLIWITGLLGVLAGFLLGFIPFINKYKLPIQIISIIVLMFGIYLEGSLANEKKWLLKVKELEAKVAKSETQSAEKNIEIQEKVVEKTKIIREKGEKQIEFITRIEKGDTVVLEKDMSEAERKKFQEQITELKKFNETCTVPSIIIDEHNKAALKPEGNKK